MVSIAQGIRVGQFGGPEVLKMDTEIPVAPLTPDGVLIKVFYAGVNPVDTYIRAGAYTTLPKLPFTPGGDAAGEVVAVGKDVKGLEIGQRVYTVINGASSGSYAAYMTAPECSVFPLGPNLTFAQGAGLGTPYFSAYRALVLRAGLKPGERLLVHGASGAVGTAAVQLARNLGAQIVGTAGTDEGLKLVKDCGAHWAFNHREEGYDKKMVEASGGGFDVILENLANVNLDRDMQMIRKGSRIMIVGNRGETKINARHLMATEANIMGVALRASSPEEMQITGAAMAAGIEAGWLKPVVDKEYALADAHKAHADIINSKGAKGNLVLKI